MRIPLGWLLCGTVMAWSSGVLAAKAPRSKMAELCDNDDGTACGTLAMALLQSEAVSEKQARRAISLLERGCDLKDAGSCSALATELDKAVWVKADPARSAEAAQKGCKLGDASSCVKLGVAYVTGKGVEQSFQKAIPLFKQACKGDTGEGCHQLGLMTLEGKGGPPDASRAAGLLEKACELESGPACARLGQMYLQGQAPPATGEAAGTPQLKKAGIFFGRGCKLDDAESCAELGKMRQAGQGMGMDEDLARELFIKACGLGDTFSCVESGVGPRDGTALEAMRQKCEDARDARACFGVGATWLKDEDSKRSEHGAALLQAACDGGVPRACYKLGLALEKGEILTKDLKRAEDLFQKACKGGYKKACGR